MPEVVDDAVVKLEFDNGQYNKNVQESITYTEALKESIDFSGLKNSFTPLLNGVNELRGGFSTASVVAISLMNRLTNDMVNGAQRIINYAIRPLHTMMLNLTSIPMKSGLEEYEMKMNSIQTIMASTGESIQTVNRHLDELNKYSDLTIYSFRDMTSNIGKFTNAGVKLEVAVNAMKGLLNEAAVSGANATEASRAMYNLAQSLSMGYVQYIDWKSIENANMATIDFKKNLAETAVRLGAIKKSADGLYTTQKGSYTLQQLFKDGLKDQWLKSKVLTDTLEMYTDQTTALGRKAQAAAQDMKTFSQMMDTVKEALQSGWAGTWQQVFGDLIEAKALWTTIGSAINNLIGDIDNFRNRILKLANTVTGGFRKNLIEAFFNIMTGAGRVLNTIRTGFEAFVNAIDDRQETTMARKIAEFVTRLSEKVKDLSQIFLINADTQRTLHAAFRATFSVGELVWRIFTELGSAAEDLASRSKPLIDAFKNIVLMASIFTMAGVDWLKSSGKITSTIDFIKESIVTGAIAIGGAIKSVTDSKAFISFLDSIKVGVKQLWDFINGFSVNFKGTSFEWLAEIFESLKNQEINVDQFETVLARIFGGINNVASKVLAGLPTILAPVYEAFKVITTFIKNILLTMDAQSLAEFAKVLVELIRLPAQLIKWAAIKDVLTGAASILYGFGDYLRSFKIAAIGNFVNGAIRSFAMVIQSVGLLFLEVAAFVGILVGASYVIKKFDLLPQFLLVFGSLTAFIIGLASLAALMKGTGTERKAKSYFFGLYSYLNEMDNPLAQVLKLTTKMAGLLVGLTAAAYILKDVDNAVESIGMLTLGVIAITGAAAYIVTQLNSPEMTMISNANLNGIIDRFYMIKQLMGVITTSIVAISIAARIAGQNSWSSIGALTGSIILITTFATELASRLSTVNSLGFDTKTFYKIFGMINAMVGSMIVSMGLFAALSNLMGSIGKYVAAVSMSVVLFAALEGLYWGASQLMPLDWAKAGSVLGICGAFVIEMVYAVGAFSLISRLIGNIIKYAAALAGATVLFYALEGAAAVLIEISKLLTGDAGQIWASLAIFAALTYICIKAFAFFTVIEHFVTDTSKYFKMIGAFITLIASIEVIMLSMMGIGYLISKFADILGAAGAIGGAVAGLVGLWILATELIVILGAFGGVFAILEFFGGTEKFTKFLNEISDFFLKFSVLTFALDVAGVLAIGALALLVPLALFPAELAVFFTEFAALVGAFGKSINSIDELTSTGITIFENLATIANRLCETADAVVPAQTSIKGLIPVLVMMIPVFGLLEVLALIFSTFGDTSKASKTVLETFESIVPVVKRISDISAYARDALSGVKALIVLMPLVAVAAAEFSKIIELSNGKFDNIEKPIENLLKVFKFISDDVANGIINTAKALNAVGSIDVVSLVKTALIGKIAGLLNQWIPWMKDLDEFIGGLASFAQEILSVDFYASKVKDWSSIAKLLSVIDTIVEAMGKFRIQSFKSLLGAFIGSNDLGELAESLEGFAKTMKAIDANIKDVDIGDNSPIKKLVNLVSSLTSAMRFFNMRGVGLKGLSGIVSNLFIGNNSLSILGEELVKFARSIVELNRTLSQEMSGVNLNKLELDWELMEKAADFIHTVVTKSAGVWNFGEGFKAGGLFTGASTGRSLLGALIGNNSIGELGKRLYEYGKYFKMFSEEVESIDLSPRKLKEMTDVIDWLDKNVETITKIEGNIMAMTADVLISSATMIYTIIDMFDDTDEQIETGFDRFMNHLNRLISNIGIILSLVIDAFTEPINAISPMVVAAFEHLEQPLIDFIAFMSSSVGDTNWLNAFATTIERVAAAIKDLTNNAIIPLLQNGLIPLEKLRLQSKFLPQLASIIKLLIILTGIIAGIIALSLATKLAGIVLAIALVVKGIEGLKNVFSGIGMIFGLAIEMLKGWLEDLGIDVDNLKEKIGEAINSIPEKIAEALGLSVDVENSTTGQSVLAGWRSIASQIYDLLVNAVESSLDYTIPGLAKRAYDLYNKYENGTAQTEYEKGSDPKEKPPREGRDSKNLLFGYNAYKGLDPTLPSASDASKWAEEQGEKNKKVIDEAYWKEFSTQGMSSQARSYLEKSADGNDHFWEEYAKQHNPSKYYEILGTEVYNYKGTALQNYLTAMDQNWSKAVETAKRKNDFHNDSQYTWIRSLIDKYLGNSKYYDKIVATLDEYYPKIQSGVSTFGSLFYEWSSYKDILGDSGDGVNKLIEELSGLGDAAGDSANKTAAAQEKQLLSESAYWAQLLEIKKQGVDGAKYQDMSLADFEEETLNTINSLYDNYLNEFNSKMSSFAGGNIFSKVDWGFDAENPFTKDELFGNLQDQIDQLDRYSNVMMSLNDRIDNEGLRKAINDMGVDSIEELETLNSLTEAELDNYEAMYVSKMESATRAATLATQSTYDQTMAEIADAIGMPDVSPEMIEQWFDGTLTSLDNMMAAKGLDFGKVGENVTAGITEGMLNDTSLQATNEAGQELAENLEECVEDPLIIESPSQLMEHNVGEMITAGIAKGMTNDNAMTRIKASAALVVAWYKSEFNEKIADFEEIGENLMKGLERGIHAGSLAASYATGISADEITNVYVRKFGIHSPSTVFEAFGNYLMEGLSLGVKNGTSNAEKTMEQSANSTLGIMQSAVEKAYAAMNSESVPAITPVVNMNKLQNGIRTMDTALAAQRSYLMANAANASIDTSVHKEVSINNQAAVDAITRLNGDILNLGDRLANMQIMLDTGIVAGQMAPAMNSELGTLMSRSIREGVG